MSSNRTVTAAATGGSTSAMTVAELEERLRTEGYTVTIGRCTNLAGAAAFLGVAPRTLRDWLQNSQGPTPIRYPSGAVFFPLENLLDRRAAEQTFDTECRNRRKDAVSGGKRVA